MEASPMSEPLDLVVRGGTLFDGTGAPARVGDLGIRGGKIAELGEVRGPARRTIDATGCAVTPGFIDIHTHYDAQVFWDRMLSISPWHGVTSVVMGNCGFGVAPTRPAHRELIMRTLENVEGMSLDALRAGIGPDWPFETFPEYPGALGFATSKSATHVGYAGRPVPSRAASLAEIERLAATLGTAGRGIVQATIGRGFFTQELADLARKTGRSVSWTALLAGALGPDGHRKVLEDHQALQRQGVPVYPQVACRPLNFEFQWSAPFPYESMEIFKPVSAADREGKKRIYADPAFRAAFRARGDRGGIAGRWSDTVVSWSPADPSL